MKAAHAFAFMMLALEAVAAPQNSTTHGTHHNALNPNALIDMRNAPLNNMYIQKLICPGAFVGLLVTFFFLSMVLIAIYQMMGIQTPLFYHHENKEQRWSKVNWGKIDADS